MKFSLRWLKKYIHINLDNKALAHKLTMAGFEVESISQIGHDLKEIVTAKILDIQPHPDADKLVITQIFDGKTTHQVVTGAKNINKNDIVPLCKVNGFVSGGKKIKKAKLRGVESFGMLCSKEECGCIGEDSEGIWILPENTPLGVDFIEYAALSDTIFDIAILPNRGDCLCIVGLARELSALLNSPLTLPPSNVDFKKDPPDFKLTVNSNDCFYYSAYFVNNFQHKTSPLWMTQLLKNVGITPHNLLIDVTNYVLIELGHPSHVFDTDFIKNRHLFVRSSYENESLTLLDKQNLKLESDMIVISDSEKDSPIALAGIMGGKDSGVSEQTSSILLEVACFNPVKIRKTSKKLAIRTESSIRFERGINFFNCDTVENRILHLYQTLANATVYRRSCSYDKRDLSSYYLPFFPERINQYLGTQLSRQGLVDSLKAFGFIIEKNNQIKVPYWRYHDIQNEACLAEEVLRFIGVDSIPGTLPIIHPQNFRSRMDILQSICRSYLSGQNLNECISLSMLSKQDCETFHINIDDCAIIQNPLSQDLMVMRPFFLPSFMKIMYHNISQSTMEMHFFEIGHCYHKKTNFYETQHCAGLFFGNGSDDPIFGKIDNTYHYFLKCRYIIDGLFQILGIPVDVVILNSIPNYSHPRLAVEFLHKGQSLGIMFVVHPLFLKEQKIKTTAVYFSLTLDLIEKFPVSTPHYKKISKYPKIRRDISFFIDKKTTYASIVAVIEKIKLPEIQNYYLYDTFQSETLGKDKKSFAIAFFYQSKSATLTDDETNKHHQEFLNNFCSHLDITIR